MDDPTQYLRFVAALIFVLGLIGAAAFALRAFGFIPQGVQRRPSQRRLSLVESLMLDARRRLVIVRRDNKEYLLLVSPTGETLLDGNIDAIVAPPSAALGSNVVAMKAETLS
jgi:flagellar protein FliO/FliZ